MRCCRAAVCATYGAAAGGANRGADGVRAAPVEARHDAVFVALSGSGQAPARRAPPGISVELVATVDRS